jgi:hypothetical protein
MRILFALAVLAAGAVHATDVTVTCGAPTTHTDGTPITGAITYTLYGGLQGAAKLKRDTQSVCRFTRTNVDPGTVEYYVTATVDGLESAPSMTVQKVISPPAASDRDGDGVPDASDACPDVKGTLANGCIPTPPSPPVNVVVSDTVAYEWRPGTSTMARVGLVPLGTPCGPELKTVATLKYCRLPIGSVDKINWPTNLKLAEVWVRTAG